MLPNIMYDPRPMYPDLYHPITTWKKRNHKGTAKYTTRTTSPVKYYLIDFGLSRKYNPSGGPPREHPILGGDKSVPEFQEWDGVLLDPFPTDIYYLGNTIRTYILKVRLITRFFAFLVSVVPQEFRNVGFLKELVDSMTRADPAERPSIDEVKGRVDDLVKSLNPQTLRTRLLSVSEEPEITPWLNIRHSFRTLRYRLLRRPTIPVYHFLSDWFGPYNSDHISYYCAKSCQPKYNIGTHIEKLLNP